MATDGQFSGPSVGSSVAAYGQFFMAANKGQRALGAAMAEFARQNGATIVAEGIETKEELAAVSEWGMTAGQGYLLGRPCVHPRNGPRGRVCTLGANKAGRRTLIPEHSR